MAITTTIESNVNGFDWNEEETETEGKVCLVRPFVSVHSSSTGKEVNKNKNRKGYHTKQELMDYNIQHQHAWREDISNHSMKHSKYLRNRVLQNMTENSFISKRLPILLQQSQELYNDTAPKKQQ